MLLFIDNYDSFTYNLIQCFHIQGVKTVIVRAEAKTSAECLSLNPSSIVIGPGPGSPSAARLSKEILQAAMGKIPILGVCLGNQVIADYFGGQVVQAQVPMHGKTSAIFHDGQGLFRQIPQGFAATRYHSLVVSDDRFPSCLMVTARTEAGEIMGVRHRELSIEGVQFHPESILSENGMTLLKNFLNSAMRK